MQRGHTDITAHVAALGSAAPAGATSEEPPMRLRCALGALMRCALRVAVLLVQGRISQPVDNLQRHIAFGDGSSAEVYLETLIDSPPPRSPAVLVVRFRLRRVRSERAHAAFQLESPLNTVLFAGFPGLVSKLWLRHDERGVYRGLYQWDNPRLAIDYVRALWWALALVSERASIHYAVLPGLDRDDVLARPSIIDEVLDAAPGGWWRPVERGTIGV
jgi:hypothetical protein